MSFKLVVKRIAIIILMAFLFAGLMVPVNGITVQADEEQGTLIRLAGENRYGTALAIAEYAFEKKGGMFDTIVLARGDGYADALSASYICATAGCPILLVDKKNVNETINAVKKMVNPNGTVYIIGGGKAVPTKVDTKLEAKGFTKIKRLAGNDRYETNYLILKEGDALYKKKNNGKVNPKVLVCSGKNYADALSCGATGLPILLTDGTVKNYQKSYINKRAEKKFFIIGGTSAVSKKMELWLKAKGHSKRIAGADRYGTSIEVAKRFFSGRKNAVIVYGDNYPDGIAACSVAHITKAPILLSSKMHVAESYNYEKSVGLQSAVIIGGKSLVANKMVAIPGGGLTVGWNTIGKHFVYVDKKGFVKIGEFKDNNKPIYPSSGGAISPVLRDWLNWPVESVITSYFGPRTGLPSWASKNHGGIDIALSYGNPVEAAADGKVIAPTGWYGGYGYVVFLQHAGGVVTVYGHNSQLLVKRGQKVKMGQVIAKVGSTGNSTGPHVHFEVRINGVNKDPLLFLPPNRYWDGD